MNVAIYGGTFDPVHLGHLAVARAAAARFKLGRIYFVPTEGNPLKVQQPPAPYYHRYAMLALALAGEKSFLPSLLEAPEVLQAEHKLASYSIDTVRRLRSRLDKRDKLFFLIGVDAFKDIARWRSPMELLRTCEFIVASRPQHSLADVALALPEELCPAKEMAKLLAMRKPDESTLKLEDVVIHLLSGVDSPVSRNQGESSGARRKTAGAVGGGGCGRLHPQTEALPRGHRTRLAGDCRQAAEGGTQNHQPGTGVAPGAAQVRETGRQIHRPPRTMKTKETREHVALVLEAAQSKKAENISLLQLPQEASAFTDYFLICSGGNPRQVQAIADEIDERLSRAGVEPLHREGYQLAEWILLDYVDFVVHIFNVGDSDARLRNLERLWKHSRHLTRADLLRGEKAPTATRAAVAKKAAKRGGKRPAKKASPVHKALAGAGKKKVAKKVRRKSKR